MKPPAASLKRPAARAISLQRRSRKRHVRVATWQVVAHPNVEVKPSRGPHNSLWYVYRDVGFLRVFWNTGLILLARWAPSQHVKRLLYRLAGAKVGRFVSFGFESTLDILYPQRITIGDDSVIGYDTTILCHGYLRHEYQVGDVTIGRDVSIGAGCTILPGVTIGDGAVVGAMSLVNKDVPAGEFWGGVPAKRIRASYSDDA